MWFFESVPQHRNITINYVRFNETAPVLPKTSTGITRAVMTIGRIAVPLSLSVTLVMVVCWNVFLRWGRRNKRRLSTALKQSFADNHGGDAGTILDAVTTVLSRLA